MADFRKKLFGLACAVTMFTGISYGQLCNTTNAISITLPATAANLRAEGQTELLPPVTLTCSGNTAASTLNVLVQIPNLTITSKVTSTSTGATEIFLTGGSSPVAGTVSGGVVTFAGVTVPPTGSVATPAVFTISNIRVNVSALATAGVFPTAVTANAFVQGITNTTSGNSSGNGLNVGFVFSALNPVSKVYASLNFANPQTTAPVLTGIPTSFNSSGINTIGAVSTSPNYAVCASTNSGSSNQGVSFYVGAVEGFAGAWKTAVDETGPGAGASAASSGTRIKLVFNNVPSGLGIYVPTVAVTFVSKTATVPSPLVASLTTSETGAFAVPAVATSPGAVSGLVALTVTGTSATAIYEITTDNTAAIDTIAIPVTLSAGSNAITNYLTNPTMTVTTSLAPQPATAASQIPSFSSTAADIVTANTVTFQACTTNLLFPFVTNVNGFETGLAISNTSKDPFKTATQSGICTLNFFASGVSGATNPTAVTAPNLAEGANQPYLAGETYAFTLTQALGVNAANPATFQGYVIAQCQFSFGHGFGYILGGLQPGMFINPNNTAMGYLALVLARGNTGSPESASF